MKKSSAQEHLKGSRLHPVSLIFFIFKAIKDLVYPLLVFIISTIVRKEVNWLWIGGGAVLFLLLLVVISYITWYRFVYTIEQGSLHVEHGVFVRKKTWISRDRVQAVNTSAGLIHRMLGLVKLSVETAGGKKPEAVLNAITARESERIRAALLPHNGVAGEVQTATDGSSAVNEEDQQGTDGEVRVGGGSTVPVRMITAQAEEPQQIRVLSLKHLLLFSATSGRVGVIIALFGAAYSQLDDVLDRMINFRGFITSWLNSHTLTAGIIVMLFAAGALLAWILAIIITSVKEYGFTLRQIGDKLVITRGLLEKKQVTVPVQSIQAIHLTQNILRRPFGLFSVHVVATGYDEKNGTSSALLFPLIAAAELPDFLQRFVPLYQLPDSWMRLEKRSLPSFMIVPLLLSTAFVIPAVIWIPGSYGWFAAIVPLFVAVSSWLNYKQTAWSPMNSQLSIQYGGFTKHQALVNRRRIQWNRVSQTPFQLRKNLTTLSVALASGRSKAMFNIRHMPKDAGYNLKGWIANKSR